MVMPAGRRIHEMALYVLGTPVSDGDGGFTQSLVALTPATAMAAIEPATAARLERLAAGTSLSVATHIVTMPYHAQVSTDTVMLHNARRFNVVGVSNPEERGRETIAICTEVLNVPAVVFEDGWIQGDWIQ